MNTKTLVFVLGAFVVGGVAGHVLTWKAIMPTTRSANTIMHHEMNGMTQALEGKTGDAFDQVFLKEMIIHHQGAVAMAESALENGAHSELKEMAKEIIAAQTAEIKQMHDWQATWYGH
jgi:uncharacterized protein (DUF305 family)